MSYARFHAPGTVYHIMSRGNHQQPIFGSSRDYQRFQSILPVHAARHGVTPLAHCFMPNHLHLLVKVGEVPVGVFMQSLLLSHAKWWNTKYEVSGHLFQGRYLPIICDCDEFFLELIRYIHLNPVKAKLVAHPSDWRWSSFAAYATGALPWVETSLALNLWSENRVVARSRFLTFLEAGIKNPDPKWKIKNGRYVSKNGVDHQETVEEKRAEERASKEALSAEIIPPITDQELLDIVSQAEGVSVEEILGRGRRTETVNLRRALVEAVHQWWGWDGSRTAKLLHKDHSTVTRIHQRNRGGAIPRVIKSKIACWKALIIQLQH